jgi:hypothetical protein
MMAVGKEQCVEVILFRGDRSQREAEETFSTRHPYFVTSVSKLQLQTYASNKASIFIFKLRIYHEQIHCEVLTRCSAKGL